MNPDDSSNISFLADGSRLLSESPILSAYSTQTGLGGEDLSLSELSLSDRSSSHHFEKPFSLLAPQGPSTPAQDNSHNLEHDLEADDLGSDPDDLYVEHAEKDMRNASKAREEKLQSDIFILRRLNGSFALFNEALQDTESANQVRLVLSLLPFILNQDWQKPNFLAYCHSIRTN